MMSSSDTELEEQLKEAGNRLIDPPSAVDELLPLLDQVESFLSKVEQSPTKSMQNALSPSLRALVTDKLLRHSDDDVKVAVASCISEITRITAPDAPYDDEQMKEIFQLIVSSFENLSDKSSRSYAKQTSILETVAKVRSCVVMLDLECDELILEMFQHFLKSIRDYHPENVISSMETIMTLVLEESEDISLELLSALLASVKKDTQEYPPIARKLGERVLKNCATKLKPCLIQAVKSSGISLDEYSKVVASVCLETSGATEHNDVHIATEQMEDKVTAGEEASHEQVDPPTNKSPKSVMSNGVAQGGDGYTLEDENSLKKQEPGRHTDQSKSINTPLDVEHNSLDSEKVADTKCKPEQSSKRRGKKPNSTKMTESISSDKKESEKFPDNRKSGKKDVPSSPLKVPTVEDDLDLEKEKVINIQLTSTKALESESVKIASPSPSGSLNDDTCLRNAGRRKKKDSSTKEVTTSAATKKSGEGTNNSEVKPNKRFRKRLSTGVLNEGRSPIMVDVPKKASRTSSDVGAKVPKQSVKVDVSSDDGEGSPSKQTQVKKRRGSGKAILEKDVKKSLAKDDYKEMGSSQKSVLKSTAVEHHLEETPKTQSKRKRTPTVEKASNAKELGEDLVGSKIKVWWPHDKKFYEGIVDSFDSTKNRHKVLYVDGDEEILNLKRQKWNFVEDDTKSDEADADGQLSPDASSETLQKKKMKINSDLLTKKGEMDASPKRGAIASSSKSKVSAKKSGRNLEDGSKIDEKPKDEQSKIVSRSDEGGSKIKDHTPKGGKKSVDEASEATTKSKVDEKKTSKSKNVDTGTPKTSAKSTQDTPKTVTKSKGKSSNTGGKSNPTGSTKVKLGSAKVKGSEDVQENVTDSSNAPESVKGKTPDSSKAQGSEVKTGKKRRRGARRW